MEHDKVKSIVEALKSLDLSIAPVEEILQYFVEMDEILPVVVLTLHPGRIIIRGQKYDSSADYMDKSRHSYKPQSLNTTYQRASTPQQTMFYGAVTPLHRFGDKPNEPNARQIIITEIGKTYSGEAEEETLVFSSWVVKQEINLVGIVQSNEYMDPSNLVSYLQKEYKKKFESLPGVEFMNYIASEFAKEDRKYIVSALFAKLCCDKGYDGVAYPSVRSYGVGMNVAIKPESVDMKLVYDGAYSCDFKRTGMSIEEVGSKEFFFS